MGKKNNANESYRDSLGFPIVLALILFAINIGVYFFDIQAGIYLTVCLCIFCVFLFVLEQRRQQQVTGRLFDISDSGQIQRKLLKELNVPYALLDVNGDLVWMNESFQQVIHKDETYRKSLSALMPEVNPEVFPKKDLSEISFSYEDRCYRAEMYKINLTYESGVSGIEELTGFQGELISLILYDETELRRYEREVSDQKMVAGIVYLDNYDEALETIEEVRRSLLLALLDRRINKYFSAYDGIVRKIESDKYFLVMTNKAFQQMTGDKFSLLEGIKNVNIGNDMAVTLSMGFGIDGDSLIQNYEFARAAIDLALGRGGDQVVVKSKDDNRYYGGKTKQVDRNTHVKARVKAQALREIMEANGNVFIMGHSIGDADSFGAAIGLFRAAKTINRRAYVVINEVTASLKPLMERFLKSTDYEEDMFIKSDRALELVDSHSTVIVVDVNIPDRCECKQLLSRTANLVVFDHHRQSKDVIKNAVLGYIEPYASSTCEMVAEILQYFDENIKLKNIEADSLYAGIMIDTNNFVRKTGVRTFEAAAYLRRCGADVSRVRKMFREDMATYKIRAAMIQNAEVYRERFAITVCPSGTVESPTVVGAQAANELLNVIGIKASFALTPYRSQIYVSARSVDELNVQVIMERLGGGGHLNIAGAQLSCSLEEAKEKIREILDKMIEEGDL